MVLCTASDGMCRARCRDDSSRAGVLQEDGGTVWGHGDGEIPFLLPVNRYSCRFSCSEDILFAIAACHFGSVSCAAPNVPGRHILLTGTMVVAGFVHA